MEPAVKRVEFVSDRVSYIVLRGPWCNIIVLNVHAAIDEKTDESKVTYENSITRFYLIQKWGERIFSNRQL
jgi:hypothetical protein